MENHMSTEVEPDIKQSEHRLRSLTIRLEEETYKKLIAIAGEKSKAEYIRAVLVSHLSAPKEHREKTAGEPPGVLEAKIKGLEDLIKEKDKAIADKEHTIKILEEDKGFVTLEYTELKQRLLMPPRRFWEFWK
jgi:methionine aminopeptidase